METRIDDEAIKSTETRMHTLHVKIVQMGSLHQLPVIILKTEIWSILNIFEISKQYKTTSILT